MFARFLGSPTGSPAYPGLPDSSDIVFAFWAFWYLTIGRAMPGRPTTPFAQDTMVLDIGESHVPVWAKRGPLVTLPKPSLPK